MIKIQGLDKYFNKGRQNEIHVINDISLELPESGMVAIFGKSGCGKTTLLNVIGGLDKFSGGSLTIEDRDIRRDTDDMRNGYIGYIFQNYNLHKNRSCFDNVADALILCGMSDKNEIEERVIAALKNVGMDKYKNRTPDTLSGGQQQRIAIARAIVKNPRIILADEPTGNLDEANTVMIMDLLKQIAKDHLVLLVTHEANLVDYYCDRVIELSDGKVVNIKNNSSASGFAAKDKNDIYLGELERYELQSENAEIEYYGESPEAPIKLKIVNSGGKLYVRIETPKVQVLDEFSEVKLREGVYESTADKNAISEDIDMSKLPPIKGSRFGRLFTLASSVKSGYLSNFSKGKKGKKLLRRCMAMFAAVIVLMSAIFGSAFKDIITVRSAYNHNVFYVHTPNGEVSSKLINAIGDPSSGIDYLRLDYSVPQGDQNIKFRLGFFETFSTALYDNSFRTNAVYLDSSLAKELPIIAGKNTDLGMDEIVITSAVADALLEKSSLGYITEHRDLIGLISSTLSIDGKALRIVGVVESDETAVYLNELAMAKYVLQNAGLYIAIDKDFGMELKEDEAVLFIRYRNLDGGEYPSVGEKVEINGKTFKVSKVLESQSDYDSWLADKKIEKKDEEAFFTELVKKENPGINENSSEFKPLYKKMQNDYYGDWLEYSYAELDEFLQEYRLFAPDNMEAWLASEKGIFEMKYYFTKGRDEYVLSHIYRELYGKYPTLTELEKNANTLREKMNERINMAYQTYSDEFYSQNFGGGTAYYPNIYIMCESDYISLAKQYGHTDVTANAYSEMGYYKSEVYYDTVYAGAIAYTVVHSSDPELTEAFIRENFSDLDTGNEYLPAIIAPNDIFDNIIEDTRREIVANFIAMAVIIAVMSLCMYFIMRSSLMGRIKEVGIYRAIGVSRKNLIFKFFIESLVLTTLTVFIGYIATSTFISVALGMSALVEEVFYYPIWLALAVFLLLYAVCTLCGIIPIFSLLRKTPSEILAKYDI
ncbi:MAG: ABC transporter ATP-binding protein/permease [Clostridia bacterium]|nr:ABC transporter ATP-binding protein/permease [Clostridia bacterium]